MARQVSDGAPYEEDVKSAGRRDQNCYEKAKARGQMTFTVVEQDNSAPDTILAWIGLNLHTAPIAKLRDAFETLLAMKASTISKKTAD